VPFRLVPELVGEEDNWEKREQDVGVDKVSSSEWRQCRPSLYEGEEDVGGKSKVCDEWVGHGLEGEFVGGSSLRLPGSSESDMGETDGSPDEEGTDTREIDNVLVCFSSTGGQVHHTERTKQVGENDGVDGNTTFVGVSKELGCHPCLGHVEDSSRSDEDGTVDGGQTGKEDESVDKVNTS
jgi:hypothetical protein